MAAQDRVLHPPLSPTQPWQPAAPHGPAQAQQAIGDGVSPPLAAHRSDPYPSPTRHADRQPSPALQAFGPARMSRAATATAPLIVEVDGAEGSLGEI